ncbi:MAG: DUF814 domain-containing protein [Myxococcales bacterium]|nr:DUF814 domain-containing protein [Myxococcales bacterium]
MGDAKKNDGLTAEEIGALSAEAASVLWRRRLDKVGAVDGHTLQLWFGERALHLALSPNLAWMFLTERRLPAPPHPPAFVMKLRAEIGGLFLSELQAPEGERVVRLVFSPGPERPGRALVVELFGRSARLLLVDEAGIVIHACLGRATVGEPYRPPEPRGSRPVGASRFPPPDPATLACNRAAEAEFFSIAEGRRLEAARAAAQKKLSEEIRRHSKKLSRLQEDRERARGGAGLIRQGELVKANLGRIPAGASEVSLSDVATPDSAPVVVRLDPARTPVENMQRLFSRGKRLAAALGAIERRVKECEERLAMLARKKAQAEQAQTPGELAQLLPGESPSREVSSARRGERLPYREYRSSSGKSILVGRSAKDNDALTFRHARGEDLWLHVRDGSGSHVVVRLGRDEVIDERTLREAAMLAAASSSLSKSDRVEVGYTRVKHVHRLPKAPAGTVSVAKMKSILIKIDPETISSLKENMLS